MKRSDPMDSWPRLERLATWLPGLRLLFAYDRSWWRHDLPAGLVVMLVLIPRRLPTPTPVAHDAQFRDRR